MVGRRVGVEAHRDLIAEAVSAMRSDATGGGATSRRGSPVNPALQGYTVAVAQAAGCGRAR